MKPNEIHNSTAPSNFSRGSKPFRPRPPRRGLNLPSLAFQSVTSAGGIIFRRRNGRSEMFFVKNATGRWTFPKGKQEAQESLVEAAIREIQEETGLRNLRYLAPVGSTVFRFRREGVMIRKTVYFFLFEAPPDAKEQMTGAEEMWEAAWVRLDRVFDVSSYRNLDRLLARALRLIAQEERRSRSFLPTTRPPYSRA